MKITTLYKNIYTISKPLHWVIVRTLDKSIHTGRRVRTRQNFPHWIEISKLHKNFYTG